jgi:hypothetical protein
MTTKQQTHKTEQTSNTKNLSWKGKSKSKSDYSVQELEGIFTVDDWLELYAFADLIDDSKGTDEYDATWAQWAEFKDEQTGEQWQQYYEKVVYPQSRGRLNGNTMKHARVKVSQSRKIPWIL